ncbi:MAG: NAAT family transporter [Alphaproteobacteria bacterium]|jgi:multiple antibiotic resistance protein|nr:NAAT family transporter [Alphaproteobacteria bacterium]
MNEAVQAFLLAASALFSIVNPLGSAFIFGQITADRSHAERSQLARKIGFYSAIVMLVALWGGTYVMNFLGVGLPALRIAGGLVVAASAWTLLQAPERQEAKKQAQASEAAGIDDVAFFPLTMPFTTGPGTISVAIALGSNLHTEKSGLVLGVAGTSMAAIVVAIVIWAAYASADRLMDLLGQTPTRVLSRVSAFLLLCVGTQIALSGIGDFVNTLR